MKTLSLISFVGFIVLMCLLPTHNVCAWVVDSGYDDSLPRVYVYTRVHGVNLPSLVSDTYTIECDLTASVTNYNYVNNWPGGNHLQTDIFYSYQIRLWLAGWKINYSSYHELEFERSGSGRLGPSRGRWTRLSRFRDHENASIDLSRTVTGWKTIKARSSMDVSGEEGGSNNREATDWLRFYFVNPF